MNGIVLFLILHIYKDAKGTNSSKKDTELNYMYLISHKASQYHWFKLSVVYFKTVIVQTQPWFTRTSFAYLNSFCSFPFCAFFPLVMQSEETLVL